MAIATHTARQWEIPAAEREEQLLREEQQALPKMIEPFQEAPPA